MSFSATSPFWVSDNGSGTATLYNSAGVKQALTVSMPAGSAPVTGQVFNGSANFNGDTFVFATENGTITGWRGALGTTAETVFSVEGAQYTGLAVAAAKDTLYAANFATGTIDVFNSGGLTGTFSDPSIPAGYAPFNIQNIGGTLYVTYALIGSGGNSAAGAGDGFVSIFNPSTHTFTRLISNGTLNSPWGIALAPVTFGAAAGDLLVGNFGDGSINAFNAGSGAYLGTLADTSGVTLSNSGLWGIAFGNGGAASSLYLTAGPNNETGGLFAEINVSSAPEPATVWPIAGGLMLLVLVQAKGYRKRRANS